MPEQVDRKAENRLCKVQNCIEDLNAIMLYASTQAKEISLFGCSLGAYFAMMAYRDEPIRQTLFLSGMHHTPATAGEASPRRQIRT